MGIACTDFGAMRVAHLVRVTHVLGLPAETIAALKNTQVPQGWVLHWNLGRLQASGTAVAPYLPLWIPTTWVPCCIGLSTCAHKVGELIKWMVQYKAQCRSFTQSVVSPLPQQLRETHVRGADIFSRHLQDKQLNGLRGGVRGGFEALNFQPACTRPYSSPCILLIYVRRPAGQPGRRLPGQPVQRVPRRVEQHGLLLWHQACDFSAARCRLVDEGACTMHAVLHDANLWMRVRAVLHDADLWMRVRAVLHDADLWMRVCAHCVQCCTTQTCG
eukprot:1161310-Pelagomonas_calceolata.AAC.3